MKSGVFLKTNKLSEIEKRVAALARKVVLVGVPAAEASRDGGPINNAALAYLHDTGSPAANVPARPFMRPGIKAAEAQIEKTFRSGLKRTLTGDKDAVEQTLTAVGLIASSSIKSKIAEGIPPALAPSTLAARRRRGRTGEVPLIDTGQLRNSITFVIRPNRKRAKGAT